MTFKTLKIELKTELKLLAQSIRKYKTMRKGAPNGVVSGLSGAQWEFRSKHIAYCLLRGRTIEQIESKHRDKNEASHQYCWKVAHQLLSEYQTKLGEQTNANVSDNS